jgi:hypothetical protein
MIYRPSSALFYGAILMPVLSSVAAAVTTTWTFNGSGNWNEAAKWSNGVPDGNTFDVVIDDGDSAATISLDSSRAINSLSLGNNDTLFISHSSTASFKTLTVANGFTNSGTIRLSGTGAGFPFSALVVTNGTLTNSATGLVDFQLGSSGSRRFTADMINQGGTIQIDAPTAFNKTNGLVEQTSGTTNLNNKLDLAFGTQFKLSGGTLNSSSGIISGGGSATNAFQYLGGTINGALTIDDTGLIVGPSITGPFSFSIRGNSRLALSNNLLAVGQTLTLQPAGPIGNAVLTSATGFTNQSSIVLIPGTGSTTFWISNSDTLLNDTNGLIRVEPAFAAPTSTIRANILNRGTVSIESSTIFEKFNSVFTNDGQFTASSAFTFGSGRKFTQIGGTSLINASFGSPSADMPAEFSGGRLLGKGAFFVPVVNSGASVEPGDSGVGNLRISGSYTQQSGGSLIAEIGGTASNQYDALTVIGPASLAGTLEVRLVDLGAGEFEPAAGQTFPILTATGGVVSQFENHVLPAIDNTLRWNVIYSTNAVSLSVSEVPEPATVMLGFVGMMMTVLFPRTIRTAFLQ